MSWSCTGHWFYHGIPCQEWIQVKLLVKANFTSSLTIPQFLCFELPECAKLFTVLQYQLRLQFTHILSWNNVILGAFTYMLNNVVSELPQTFKTVMIHGSLWIEQKGGVWRDSNSLCFMFPEKATKSACSALSACPVQECLKNNQTFSKEP